MTRYQRIGRFEAVPRRCCCDLSVCFIVGFSLLIIIRIEVISQKYTDDRCIQYSPKMVLELGSRYPPVQVE